VAHAAAAGSGGYPAWKTKNVLLTVAVGMGALLVFQFVLGMI
jgi:branched-subunit amino acid transport protein